MTVETCRALERMTLHLEIFIDPFSVEIYSDFFKIHRLGLVPLLSIAGVHEVRTFVLAYLLVLAGQSLARSHITNRWV